MEETMRSETKLVVDKNGNNPDHVKGAEMIRKSLGYIASQANPGEEDAWEEVYMLTDIASRFAENLLKGKTNGKM
jgi:hypothetical protein